MWLMADFLKRNRAEVVKMCLYEYDEEKQREFDREEGRMELLEELVRKKLKRDIRKKRLWILLKSIRIPLKRLSLQ